LGWKHTLGFMVLGGPVDDSRELRRKVKCGRTMTSVMAKAMNPEGRGAYVIMFRDSLIDI
jgi:hypothetical protein